MYFRVGEKIRWDRVCIFIIIKVWILLLFKKICFIVLFCKEEGENKFIYVLGYLKNECKKEGIIFYFFNLF